VSWAAGRFRREEALALHREGVTITRIGPAVPHQQATRVGSGERDRGAPETIAETRSRHPPVMPGSGARGAIHPPRREECVRLESDPHRPVARPHGRRAERKPTAVRPA
jgi:hypothetical protein